MGEVGILIPIRVDREQMRALLMHLLQARNSEGVCEALGWYRMDSALEAAQEAGLIGIAQHIQSILDRSPTVGVHVAAFDARRKEKR
jgi:hypothetical protein